MGARSKAKKPNPPKGRFLRRRRVLCQKNTGCWIPIHKNGGLSLPLSYSTGCEDGPLEGQEEKLLSVLSAGGTSIDEKPRPEPRRGY